MIKYVLDFVGNMFDFLSFLLVIVVEIFFVLVILVVVKLLVIEDVLVMMIEFDVVIFDFVCMEFVYKDNEGEGVVNFVVLVLMFDWRNWKNSMVVSRFCGSNICKRVDISILR